MSRYITRPPTYFHVVDEHTGEHIATYTDRSAAYARSTDEALTNGRDFCAVFIGEVA